MNLIALGIFTNLQLDWTNCSLRNSSQGMRFNIVKLTWYRNLKAGKTTLCCWSRACVISDWNSDAFLIVKTAPRSLWFLACRALTYDLIWVPGGPGEAGFPSCIHAWSSVACIDCNHALGRIVTTDLPYARTSTHSYMFSIWSCNHYGSLSCTDCACSCHRQQLYSSLHQQNGFSTFIPHGERINQQK